MSAELQFRCLSGNQPTAPNPHIPTLMRRLSARGRDRREPRRGVDGGLNRRARRVPNAQRAARSGPSLTGCPYCVPTGMTRRFTPGGRSVPHVRLAGRGNRHCGIADGSWTDLRAATTVYPRRPTHNPGARTPGTMPNPNWANRGRRRVPSFDARNVRTRRDRRTRRRVVPGQRHSETRKRHQKGPESVSHTIFEGTSEIQQLVIARAISGVSSRCGIGWALSL